MKTYKVIGVKLPKENETDEQKFGQVKDSNEVLWDPGSEVTSVQVDDELAATLVANGEIELIRDDSK